MFKKYLSRLLVGMTALVAVSAAQAGAIDEAVKRGTLRVGMDPTYMPFQLTNKRGEIIGFEVDILKAMAKSMGVKFEAVSTAYDGIIPALLTDKFDMIGSGMTLTQERNLRLNGLTGRQHRLMQADCLSWLRESDETFDLIFIDPPTFSNSKRMEEDFDVQRDHIMLMRNLKRLLRAGGTVMFSNNKRGFKMDLEGLASLGLKAQDITQKTLSQDFARNRQIHNCWLITHAGKE